MRTSLRAMRQDLRRPVADDVFKLAIHDVSRNLHRRDEPGRIPAPSLDELTKMRIHGVDAVYVARDAQGRIRQADRRRAGEDAHPRRHAGVRAGGQRRGLEGVRRRSGEDADPRRDARFIREMRSLGYKDLDVDDVVKIRIHGVSPAFIREMGDSATRTSRSRTWYGCGFTASRRIRQGVARTRLQQRAGRRPREDAHPRRHAASSSATSTPRASRTCRRTTSWTSASTDARWLKKRLAPAAREQKLERLGEPAGPGRLPNGTRHPRRSPSTAARPRPARPQDRRRDAARWRRFPRFQSSRRVSAVPTPR